MANRASVLERHRQLIAEKLAKLKALAKGPCVLCGGRLRKPSPPATPAPTPPAAERRILERSRKSEEQ